MKLLYFVVLIPAFLCCADRTPPEKKEATVHVYVGHPKSKPAVTVFEPYPHKALYQLQRKKARKIKYNYDADQEEKSL